ncbi:MAG: SNF2-related protein [Alphaproteobacteria bacterium]
MGQSSAIVAHPPFGEADIRRCLPGEIEKGRRYFLRGAVCGLRAEEDGSRLIAEVQGTRATPYRVEIAIEHSRKGVKLAGQCSCPVGWNCKHCAAALLQALEEPPSGLAATPPNPLDGPLAAWLAQLPSAALQEAETVETLVYRLDRPRNTGRSFTIEARIVRPLKSGRLGAGRGCSLADLHQSRARHVGPEDRLIARLMRNSYWSTATLLPDDPETLGLLMQRLLQTGRCYWHEIAGVPLALGPKRRGEFAWRLDNNGNQAVEARLAEGAGEILPCTAPWYVDPEQNLAGPIDFGVKADIAAAFLAAPPVAPDQAAALAEALARRFPGLGLPAPRTDVAEEIRHDPPVPVLRLATRKRAHRYSFGPGRGDDRIDLAFLGYEYDGRIIDPAAAPPELRHVVDGRVVVRRRHYAAEARFQRRLAESGLLPTADFARVKGEGRLLGFSFDHDPAAWAVFVYGTVPALEQDGWQIDIDPEFRPRIVAGDGDWNAFVSEGGGWWFSLDLGIEIDGERVPLLPVLTSLLRRVRDLENGLDAIAVGDVVFGRLDDGRHIALPLDRTKAILATLVELFHPESLSPDGTLGISMGEAVALAEIEAATRLRWLGGERLRTLAERLRGFSGVRTVAPPSGLRATLRDYQLQGLSWLQFLREFDLGGILADDMGLGKTVQTLAHILVEKREGRLDRPCLVVCPTSVVPNWQAEAARFAPELRVLSLHGADRHGRFADIPDSDVVLTTYALLPRDAERLLPVPWHLAVLDEAQAIKNATAKVTALVCQLDARHRLCLTGTPVENHLGELWSQFAFLTPGLLGDSKRFTRVFRTPIEKKTDGERRAVLATRLKPFLLRRTKDLVARELPPKTEIVSPLELSGPQRDLYETVRLAMHDKVRREIAAKGFSRSRIVILEALLKLRQVCCDPRLVKLAAARKVAASAKLEHLMQILPPLIEDGRRVLLFSQFTSMLDLIEPELQRAGIDFVEIRGDTRDRAAPVRRFQSGKVPLFLISLRAGGTGLNLTAADTVIHYDPWWNPAVEDQATDRAHRIGQDKAVFVYKLIARGTVEERMLDLQARKRSLASGIYGDREDGGPMFDAADLERLFEPLG